MENQAKIIKEIIETFLHKLCIDFDEVEYINSNNFNDGVKFVIKTNDSGVLIGNEGVNIYAFNHILKKIVWKKINTPEEEKINFFVDVNNYQGKNIERIQKEALEVAKKVEMFKREMEMPASNSYERMIIHSILADNPNIYTESIGEGEFRRVVIKNKEQKTTS
ncbi:MAG: R3H domain-containing nucleic acid-binding protein [Patescibacteria group bacterium]